ncbi:MAG TPA: PstS family phosphate ABC transporter substrate-binding protein [Spirochaetota bacterium]|nr:PstS family phosphate ABC transporter substrate-binding protein [Spirochaetota bacterium]HNT11123.1 PstS family phosphate ABC transporter substrate-binding protein [Spirochaetota bacterium]
MARRITGIISALIIAGTAFAAIGCSRDTGNKIVIKGSTTVLPITQKVAEAFRKTNKVAISVEGSGSGNGIKAVIDGTCDIGNSSREMKGNEIEEAKKKGVTPKEIVAAYDMIVPIVHPKNPVKDLTMDQLKGIYDGSINDWSTVGGTPGAIVVISRDTSSGTYEIWHEKVLKKKDVRKDALLQASNGAIISSVSTNPKAIGYIGFGYLNDTVRTVTVNKVEGTIENGKSGKYPVSRKLYMYVNEKRITPQTQAFLDYLLGAEGQKLVKEAGFIPL